MEVVAAVERGEQRRDGPLDQERVGAGVRLAAEGRDDVADLGRVAGVIVHEALHERGLGGGEFTGGQRRLVHVERGVLDRLQRAQPRHVVDRHVGQRGLWRSDAETARIGATGSVGAARGEQRAE